MFKFLLPLIYCIYPIASPYLCPVRGFAFTRLSSIGSSIYPRWVLGIYRLYVEGDASLGYSTSTRISSFFILRSFDHNRSAPFFLDDLTIRIVGSVYLATRSAHSAALAMDNGQWTMKTTQDSVSPKRAGADSADSTRILILYCTWTYEDILQDKHKKLIQVVWFGIKLRRRWHLASYRKMQALFQRKGFLGLPPVPPLPSIAIYSNTVPRFVPFCI